MIFSISITRYFIWLLVISEVAVIIEGSRPTCGAGGIVPLSEVNGINGYRINITTGFGRKGHTICSPGDINDDGTMDILVGVSSSMSKTSVIDSGSGKVYYGGSSYTDPVDIAIRNSNTSYFISAATDGDRLGYSVSGIGDVNGDGFDDYAIAADGYNTDQGSVYVIFGIDGPLASPTIRVALLTAALTGFKVTGLASAGREGIVVRAAGDVNGDGFSDIIIGAHFTNSVGDSQVGEVFVVYGAAAFTDTFDVNLLDGTNGFVIDISTLGVSAGASVNGVGDMNGDGFDDVAVGVSLNNARTHSGQFTESGIIYVFFGGTSLASILTTSSIDISGGFRFLGASDRAHLGASIAAADVNGDGFSDMIVGAPGVNNGAGATYVYYGASSLSKGSDTSLINGANGIVINGIAANDLSGGSVSSAGDFNGDGYEEILIGAAGANPNGMNGAGEVYLVYGGPSLPTTTNVADLDGIRGLRYQGVASGDATGTSVTTGVDVNGDSWPDLLISAPNSSDTGGVAYVVLCAPASNATRIPTATPTTSPTVVTLPSNDAGTASSGSGSVITPMVAEIAVGVLVLVLAAIGLYMYYRSMAASDSKYKSLAAPTVVDGGTNDLENGHLINAAQVKPVMVPSVTGTSADISKIHIASGSVDKISIAQDTDTLSSLPVGLGGAIKSLHALQTTYKSLFIKQEDIVLGSMLGKGGFGVVVKATVSHQTVAIKQYLCDRLPEKVMEEVCNEVNVMKDLRHVNLVALLGVVDNPHSSPWLVMEYCGGGDLYHLLHSKEEILWPVRLRLAADIIGGLMYLHQHRIVHCDMKSVNVLLTDSKQCKLADFGLSVVRDHSTTVLDLGTAAAAGASTVGGTIRWMAPEMFTREYSKPSRASDMWAFGMVLFEIAARKLPYAEGNDIQVRGWLKDNELEQVPEECRRESPGLAVVMERCWLLRVERPTAEEIADIIFALQPKSSKRI